VKPAAITPPTIKADDYARLHLAYHEDTDLEMVADALDDEHDAGYLVWLYWPRMIARAKSAKSFGWFETTPRKLAESVRDRSSWNVRQRMWQLLQQSGSVRVRQGAIDTPSAKVDLLLVKWEKWQVDTTAERKKRERERARIVDGKGVHWTLSHLDEFCDVKAVRCDEVTEIRPGVTKRDPNVTPEKGSVTTHDTTRQDEEEHTSNNAKSIDRTAASKRAAEIENVYDYWCKVERETGGIGSTGKGRPPKLTKERRAKINARLDEGYSPADLKMAIAFYSRDPHHIGGTNGVRYTDLMTTLKNGAKVEAGVAGYESKGAVAAAGGDERAAALLSYYAQQKTVDGAA